MLIGQETSPYPAQNHWAVYVDDSQRLCVGRIGINELASAIESSVSKDTVRHIGKGSRVQ